MLRICLSGFIVPQETRPVTEERRVRGDGARKQHARQTPSGSAKRRSGSARQATGEHAAEQETASSGQSRPRHEERHGWDGEALHAGGRWTGRWASAGTLGKEYQTKPGCRRREPEKWQGPFEPEVLFKRLIWAFAWSSATKHATVLVCLAISRARGVRQGVRTKRRQMGGMAKQTEGNALQKSPSLQETMLRYWRHAERSAP